MNEPTLPPNDDDPPAPPSVSPTPAPPAPGRLRRLWRKAAASPVVHRLDRIARLIIRVIDGTNEGIGIGVSWLTSGLVVLVCFNVLMRYGFRRTNGAMQELEWHTFAAIFLLGAAYTLKHDRHVRVDIIYQMLPPRGKALVNLLGALFMLLPFCLITIAASRGYVMLSWHDRETSPDSGGLPGRYILKAFIPLCFGLLALQGVSMALSNLRILCGAAPLTPPPPEDAPTERESL